MPRSIRLSPPLSAVLVLGSIAVFLPGAVGQCAKTCHMNNPDLAVYGIRLIDSESAARQVGSGPDIREDTDDLPHARFVSTNGAQELILFAHYGAGLDEYAEVEVREAGTEALAIKELAVETFRTERGIELGMSAAQVVERFGKCIKSREKEGSSETIQYEADAANDPSLKAFGYPVYYAEYEFHGGKLVRFRFGFEIP